jgi:hypothetical protein
MAGDIFSSISGLSDSGSNDSASPQPNYVAAPASPGAADLPPGVTPIAGSPTAQAATSAQPRVLPPGTPHGGLLNIMDSLFLGMSAFAKSAATGGREGGPEEVEQVLNQRKEMALKQQDSQRASTLADAQIKHTQALTNATIAQTQINTMNAPEEHQKLVMDNQKALYDLYVNVLHINPLFAVPIVQGQTTDAHMSALNAKAGGDLVGNTVLPVHDDKPGGPGTSHGFSFDQLRQVNIPIEQAGPVLANLQNQITLAKSVLPDGEKDPAIQAAQGKLDVMKKGGSVNGYDFYVFDNQVQAQILSRVANQQAISEFQQKQAAATKAKQEADPLFKLENDPSSLSGEKTSAAIPQLQAKLQDPATSPQDKVRATRLLAVAQSAHTWFLQDTIQKANAEQQAKQGDPAAAGAMLAKGDLTLSDMKTRGMTPKFILDATKAAQAIDPKYNPADEMIAEQVAKSPHANQFFGSANSLISKGGTLDQVVAAGAKLPNAQLPIFNKISDAVNYESGHPEVAAYMQTALGAADDYAKVLGGGTGTEGMQLKILNAMNAAQNQDQRTSVVNAMRGAVNSQVESRIGNNKFLQRLYGYALPGAQAAAPAERAVYGPDKTTIIGYTTDGKTMRPAK